MSDFRGGQTIFNQAQFQMIRLHELMTKVNECWLNFGGYVDGIPAHQVMFNILSAYYLEIESTFTEKEEQEVNTMLEKVESLITTKSLIKTVSNHSFGGIQRRKTIDYQTFYEFRKELREFQKIILQNAQKHGIGNPTKKDPSKAVLN